MPTEIVLHLPEEFLELCRYNLVSPEKVFNSFIVDLCDIPTYVSEPDRVIYGNTSSDRDRAKAYFSRAYSYTADWIRSNLPHLIKDEGYTTDID